MRPAGSLPLALLALALLALPVAAQQQVGVSATVLPASPVLTEVELSADGSLAVSARTRSEDVASLKGVSIRLLLPESLHAAEGDVVPLSIPAAGLLRGTLPAPGGAGEYAGTVTVTIVQTG